MKAASLNEIRKELILKSPLELHEICLKLAKFDVKSKEYLSYIVFESDNIELYISKIKSELDESFTEKFPTNTYYLKKELQKRLKRTTKLIKFSSDKRVETEILLHWILCTRKAKIAIQSSQVLINMEQRILKKIESAISKMHEDLQFDYQQQLEKFYTI